MKTIEITVGFDKDGQFVQTLETSGFQGGECLRASAPFESLGGQTVQEEMTAERHGGACHFVPETPL